MSELFYVFGIGLTLMAVAVAYVGMRMEGFPSRPVMIGGLSLMAFLVVGSAAFAVVLSREEHEIREDEIAEYRAEQAAEEGEAQGQEGSGGEVPAADALALTSPEAGDLVFDPTTLEAEAGEVTIDYTNPSEVPHNVAIEDGSETVAQGETVTGGDSGPASATLEPGEYAYYCSIPTHREAGMEGELTVE
jgi:plastocyanin